MLEGQLSEKTHEINGLMMQLETMRVNQSKAGEQELLEATVAS